MGTGPFSRCEKINRSPLLIVCATLLCSPAHAADNGGPALRYYDVHGSTARELRVAMDREGPTGTDGERYDARTAWRIRWDFRFSKTEQGCTLRSYEAAVSVEVLLPRWKHGAGAPTDLVARWTDYLAALSTHESGHVELARQAAAEMHRRAARFGPRARCSELGAALSAMGREVLEEYRARERRYETGTGHGRTQGARFP